MAHKYARISLTRDQLLAIYKILAVRANDRSYGLTLIEQEVADKIANRLSLTPLVTFKNKVKP